MIFFKSWVLFQSWVNIMVIWYACSLLVLIILLHILASVHEREREILQKEHRHLILQSMLYVNIKTRHLNSVLSNPDCNSNALVLSSMHNFKVIFLTFIYEQIVDAYIICKWRNGNYSFRNDGQFWFQLFHHIIFI